nr:Myo-inositol 2-dehydrogenase [Raoultella ornithinolytica]
MLARPDIDAVYVATPHNHHFPDGLRVLQAGKHVLIEKPFALNRREGAALKAEALKQGSWRWRRCGAITRRNMT